MARPPHIVSGQAGTGWLTRSIVVALLAWLAAAPLQAGQFNVSPVKVTLPARAKATSVTITNNGRKPLALRIRLYAWDKHEGEDRLQAAEDLLVTPPILKLEPGRAQIVRIGRPAEIPVPAVEKAYRLVVSELPLPGEGQAESTLALRSLLEISVPVFVPPARPDKRLEWTLQPGPQPAAATVSVRNAGTVHSKLTRLRLLDAGGQLLAESQKMLYALPQQQARTPLLLSRPLRTGETLKLEYTLDHAVRVIELKAP
ncbi:MAG TPA: fimbria/pilus periplasmic chaperone [Nevskiales bacterium]|nr:fimbria/pilus periplasmic chaperone [Nevskiales bacterium]